MLQISFSNVAMAFELLSTPATSPVTAVNPKKGDEGSVIFRKVKQVVH